MLPALLKDREIMKGIQKNGTNTKQNKMGDIYIGLDPPTI